MVPYGTLWYLMVPYGTCLLYTSDAADEGLGVDLGGRRIIKKKHMRAHVFLIQKNV